MHSISTIPQFHSTIPPAIPLFLRAPLARLYKVKGDTAMESPLPQRPTVLTSPL